MEKLEFIIESLLFSSSEPLSIADFKKITQKSKQDIQITLQEIKKFYKNQDRSFQLTQIASGYQLRTKQIFTPWIKKNTLTKKQYLTKSALETLSVIIYKQPISKQDINQARSIDSSSTIQSLLQKKLIRIAGRRDSVGKPLLYATSTKLLDVLGIKKLSDIPQPND